jgi:hypothetical protein
MKPHDKMVERIARVYAATYNTEGAHAAQRYAARVIDNDADLKKRVREQIKRLAKGDK